MKIQSFPHFDNDGSTYWLTKDKILYREVGPAVEYADGVNYEWKTINTGKSVGYIGNDILWWYNIPHPYKFDFTVYLPDDWTFNLYSLKDLLRASALIDQRVIEYTEQMKDGTFWKW